jgi:hypothetical protein
MKKGLLMLLAGLMTIGVSVGAFADARLDSMAADARQVGDMDLIWYYPNMAVDYKNTVDFRLFPYNDDEGEGDNEWGGALLEVDPSIGTLGFYVNRPVDDDSINYGLLDSGPVRPLFRYSQGRVGNAPWYMNDSEYVNDADVFWAKDNVGLHFTYGDGGTETQVYGLSGGIGLGDVGPFGDLNVHLGYTGESSNYGSHDHNYASTTTLGALTTSAINADNDWRTYLDLQFDGSNYNEDEPGNVYGDYAVQLGTALNHKIDSGKGLLSTGLLIDYLNAWSPSVDEGFAYEEWNLLWNASIEAPVNDWLTLRAGLTKDIVSRLYDKYRSYFGQPIYSNNADDNVEFSTGFAINWQNFTLDTTVSAESLENSINNVEPGRGIFFGGEIVEVDEADLKYKF